MLIIFWPAMQLARAQTITATVDPTTVLVTNYEGLCTSLSWWANVAGGFANRTNYCNFAFTTLKLNIVRYNIGDGENPNIPDKLQFRARIPGFEPTSGVWNWNADVHVHESGRHKLDGCLHQPI